MLQRRQIRVINLESQLNYQYILLAIITLVAAALRFYKLGEWSFWVDEILTINRANQDLLNIFANPFDQNLSVSTVLIHFSLRILGINEWNARLVPALIGIATVIIAYFPIRKLLGPGIALLTSFLLAISPWHIYLSQNVRYYSALLFFYTLALLFFYSGIERHRVNLLIISVLLLALATAERLFALIFIPVVVGYLVMLVILPTQNIPRPSLKTLLIIFIPTIAVALFFTQEFIREPGRWQEIWFGRDNQGALSILSQIVFYHLRAPIVWLALLGSLSLIIAGDQKRRLGLLLTLAAGIPVLIVLVASLFQFSEARYAAVSLLPWLILAGAGIAALLSWVRGNVKLLAVGIIVFLLLNPIKQNLAYYNYLHGERPDWKSAFALIKEQKEPDDLIFSNKPPIGDYYLGEETKGTETIDPYELSHSEKRVWFALQQNLVRVDPALQSWIEENSELKHDNFKVLVYLYTPGSPKPQVSY